MSDELAYERIEKLTADEYVTAFRAIAERMTVYELLMLQAHYKSPKQVITATELANKVGFPPDVRTHLAEWLPSLGCNVDPATAITESRFSIAGEWR